MDDNVFDSFDVVALDYGIEHWETMFDIQGILESVGEDTSDLNLISRSGLINIITKKNHILMSWDSARWNCTRCLLYSQLLIVPVDCLGLIDLERSFGLTKHTVTKEDLIVVVLIDWTLILTTSLANEPDLLQLREDS